MNVGFYDLNVEIKVFLFLLYVQFVGADLQPSLQTVEVIDKIQYLSEIYNFLCNHDVFNL
jgi:hypothetical protein